MKRLSRARWVFVYYLSWLVFGGVGLLLNVACAPLLWMPRRASYGRTVRSAIRRLFSAWLGWLHATGVVGLEWRGFESPLAGATVYVANHPTLVDATFVLARLPDAFCIFKPSLMRNPAIGPAAIMAGYVRGNTGLDLIKEAASKVAAGQSLLVFPEGTRTAEGAVVGRLKPGFALIADRAKAPIRLIIIESLPGFCTRGRPWWPAPRPLPSRYRITLDAAWPYEPGRSAAELTRAVEERICMVLGRPEPG